MGPARIVLSHVLPNIWGPIIVNTAVLGAVILGIQGGLNYINLGVNPPAASWGGMGQRRAARTVAAALADRAERHDADACHHVADAGRRRAPGCSGQQPLAAGQAAGRRRPRPPLPKRLSPLPTPPRRLSVRGLSVSIAGLEVVKNVAFDNRRRPDPRHRRRVGMRQDGYGLGGARPARPGVPGRGHGDVRRHRSQSRAVPAAGTNPRHRHRLHIPGPDGGARSLLHRREPARRAGRPTRQAARGRHGAPACSNCCARWIARSRRHRGALPAPAVGRHGAAGSRSPVRSPGGRGC